MLSEPPIVGFVGRDPSAVNPRLLSGANSNDLSVFGQTDGVTLSELESDERHQDITFDVGSKALRGGNAMNERLNE